MNKMTESPILLVLSWYGCDVDTDKENNRGWIPVHCPFHSPDNRRSAGVNPRLGIFQCFACGRSGNAVALIMQEEDLDEEAARQYLIAELEISP